MQKIKQKHSVPWIHFAVGVAAAVLSGFAVMACMARLYVSVDLPLQAAAPLSTAAICVGCLIGSMILGVLRKEKGLLWGVLCSASVFVLVFIYAAANGLQNFSPYFVVKLASMLLSGGLGGFTGVVLHEKKRKKLR